MSHIIAMLVASTGIALNAGPADCSAKKDCPLEAAKSSTCDSAEKMACSSEKMACSMEKTADGSMEATAHTVAMTTISPDAYTNAAWPAHNDDLYANNLQGKTLPVALGNETWLSESVQTQGKVVVLDFWATWCPPCRAASPILDELQKENADTLAVLAISGQREEIDDVKSYVADNEVAYAHLFDANQSVYKEFESRGIPLVVVMSTDGMIRWMGNPHEEGFLPAVKQTLSVDPAVQSRIVEVIDG
ncbi:MAG: TlpA disulfide reductase family protein [Phycisphaerales bacterium]